MGIERPRKPGRRALALLAVLLPVTGTVAAPLDMAKVRNAAPDALSAGLYLHSSLTAETRRLLIEDLAWLSEQKAIPGSGTLARAIGLSSPTVDGIQLVAWLTRHVSLVSGTDWDAMANLVTVSDIAPTRGIMVFASRARKTSGPSGENILGDTHGLGSGMLGTYWRLPNQKGPEVEGFLADDRIVLAPMSRGDAPPYVRINPQAVKAAAADFTRGKPSARIERIVRLGVLLHEAAHVANPGTQHGHCAHESLAPESSYRFGGYQESGIPRSPKAMHCDDHRLGSAWVVSYAFAGAMAEACSGCTPEDVRALRKATVTYAARAQARFSAPYAIPQSAVSAADTANVVGRTFVAVPPKAWFDGLVAYVRLAYPGDKLAIQTISATSEALRKAETKDAFRDGWSSPSPDGTIRPYSGDVEGTRAWLKRASASPGNPPLTLAPPCAQFANGCTPK